MRDLYGIQVLVLRFARVMDKCRAVCGCAGLMRRLQGSGWFGFQVAACFCKVAALGLLKPVSKFWLASAVDDSAVSGCGRLLLSIVRRVIASTDRLAAASLEGQSCSFVASYLSYFA